MFAHLPDPIFAKASFYSLFTHNSRGRKKKRKKKLPKLSSSSLPFFLSRQCFILPPSSVGKNRFVFTRKQQQDLPLYFGKKEKKSEKKQDRVCDEEKHVEVVCIRLLYSLHFRLQHIYRKGLVWHTLSRRGVGEGGLAAMYFGWREILFIYFFRWLRERTFPGEPP